MKRRLAGTTALAVLVLAPGSVRADDYVTVRGAYYREASTRVIQPIVEVQRDTPSGWDVRAHFLVDAITSASVSAGTNVDQIFTETRNETGFMVRKRWTRTEISGGYKYSAESDYWSHAGGLGGSTRFWGDTARVGLSLGVSLDSVSARARTPCVPETQNGAAPVSPLEGACPLRGYFAGFSYTQILSPSLLGQVAVESNFLHGFQSNLYRSVPNFGYEKLPNTRWRNAVAARIAYQLPNSAATVRLAYRYYVDFQPGDRGFPDPWNIRSHMIEGRLYHPLSDTLDLRVSFRQYFQNHAGLWCDALANAGCYPRNARYYTTDPKLGPVRTSYPEVKLVWQAAAFADIPVLRWIAAGMFEISYGRYFQNTSFGNAHLLQSGYTLPY